MTEKKSEKAPVDLVVPIRKKKCVKAKLVSKGDTADEA